MDITPISSPNAATPIGPYSQAVRAGDFIFCSGVAGFDPKTGRIVEGGIREQTAAALNNLGAVLESAGSSLGRVVKVTIFLHDWKYFREMNEAYAKFFPENPPARTTAQGARWPEGSLLAMEAIALAP
ncbi:MAG: Rid family detoxifying hydrolase [Candidatus Eiseniibacteriota bacterium]